MGNLLQWLSVLNKRAYSSWLTYLGNLGNRQLDANGRSGSWLAFGVNAPRLSDCGLARWWKFAVNSVCSLAGTVLECSVAWLVGQDSKRLVGSVDDGTGARAEDTVVSVVVADNVECKSGNGRFISRSDPLVAVINIKVGQSNRVGNSLAIGGSVDVSDTSNDVLAVKGGNNVNGGTGGNLIGLGQGSNGRLGVDDLLICVGGNGSGPVVNDTVESLVAGLGEDYILLPVGGGARGASKLLYQQRVSIFSCMHGLRVTYGHSR